MGIPMDTDKIRVLPRLRGRLSANGRSLQIFFICNTISYFVQALALQAFDALHILVLTVRLSFIMIVVVSAMIQ